MSHPRLIALLLAFATLLVYLPVTRSGFLNYDDDDYVTNNHVVQNGLTLAGVKWAFTTGHASNWHPLTWLSHMTDCALFGLNPGAHHLVNVLFHSANAALLFILLRRLTRRLWPSALVAALFAWHPLHVESVAWISERKDVLSTFFALLALLSYAKFAQENSRRSFWSALFFFVLGLLAKPMLVTLPFVLLLLDFWPLQRFKVLGSGFKVQALVLEKIPFFLLSAASCAVTFLVQHGGHAVASLDEIPLSHRLENAPVAAASYLWKMFWPSPLAVIYPIRKIPATTTGLAVAVLVFISAAVWLVRKKNPCWLFGWLWFLGTLVPVIGLVQVGSAAMADRYTYLPATGIFTAIVFGLDGLAQRFPLPKIIFPAAAVFILGACLILTEKQLRYWHDSEALFRHALAVTENNEVAHVDHGVALNLQGQTDEALAEYRAAERLNPDRCQVHVNIGNLLEKLGQPADALAEYREAVRRDPHVPLPHCAAGSELAELGRFDEALKEFSEAERLDPDYAQPHAETAKVFFKQGRDAEAVDELRTAVRCEPENFQILATAAHYLAANKNDAARDGHAALAFALMAGALSGNSQPMVFDALGMAFAENGNFTNAQTCAQNALDLATAAKLKIIEPLRQRLELYKNHQPWRESFLATNNPAAIHP
jgi:tetratricopeptide (TPR) repeat protein